MSSVGVKLATYFEDRSHDLVEEKDHSHYILPFLHHHYSLSMITSITPLLTNLAIHNSGKKWIFVWENLIEWFFISEFVSLEALFSVIISTQWNYLFLLCMSTQTLSWTNIHTYPFVRRNSFGHLNNSMTWLT